MPDHIDYNVGCPKCGHKFVYKAKVVKEVIESSAFGEKKVWDSYLVLEYYAKEREYAPIGIAKCISYLVSYISVSDNVARKILRKMAKDPYCFIVVRGGQAYVKHREVVEKIMRDTPKILLELKK